MVCGLQVWLHANGKSGPLNVVIVHVHVMYMGYVLVSM